MESVNRVVDYIEEEIAVVEKKMRKLRDSKQSGTDEFLELRSELEVLKGLWDMLN